MIPVLPHHWVLESCPQSRTWVSLRHAAGESPAAERKTAGKRHRQLL